MKDVFSWEYEQSVMPPELLEVAFDFDRDVKKLWSLELPIREIPMSLLEWHLDAPFFWKDKDMPFSLKPRDVINNPEQYPYHMDRILTVDTSYPIDIIWWKERWVMLDGLHRYCKLHILQEEFFKGRELPVERRFEIMPD